MKINVVFHLGVFQQRFHCMENLQANPPTTFVFWYFYSLSSLCTHAFAWSEVSFLCCTVCLEHSSSRNPPLILQIMSQNMSFPAVLLIACTCVWPSGLLHRVCVSFFWYFDHFFLYFLLFHVMGLVLWWKNGTEEKTLYYLSWNCFSSLFFNLSAMWHTHLYNRSSSLVDFCLNPNQKVDWFGLFYQFYFIGCNYCDIKLSSALTCAR